MVLVDANVLLDVLTDDPAWGEWSANAMRDAYEREGLAINPIVYAELAPPYRTARELDAQLAGWLLERLPLPYEAGFLTGQAFVRYRRQGGQRRSPLPDFYIGAHAQWAGFTLLTRDAAHYRTYFPKLRLIAPE